MSPFYIVLATVAIRLVNIHSGKASEHPYIVSIYNKHTGTAKGSQICAGSLVTNSYVLTTRFCLPHHAYKIRYGDMKTVEYPTYSQILHRKYHRNSRPEITSHHGVNKKQVVSGSNNIAMALIQKISDQKFGQIIAVDYRSLVGHEVKFFTFDMTHTAALKSYSKKKRFEQLNLQTIFKRKKKILREHFIYMSRNRTAVRPFPQVRHQLTQQSDLTHVMHNILRFASGIVTPCEDKTSTGPSMCVVEKCLDHTDSRQSYLIPDLGTPLIHDGKIVGIAADIEESSLKYTPISPFLNWITSYVKLESTNATMKPMLKRKIIRHHKRIV